MPLDMTDDELLAELRGNLGKTTSYGASPYLDEINHRSVDRQTRELISLTASIHALTAETRTLTRLVMLVAGRGVGRLGSCPRRRPMTRNLNRAAN
jgi:hypothetical protein